jgi:hypothetical protein
MPLSIEPALILEAGTYGSLHRASRHQQAGAARPSSDIACLLCDCGRRDDLPDCSGALVQPIHPRSSGHCVEAIGSACNTGAPSYPLTIGSLRCFIVKVLGGFVAIANVGQLILIGRDAVSDGAIFGVPARLTRRAALPGSHSYRCSGETTRPPISQPSQESASTLATPQNLR